MTLWLRAEAGGFVGAGHLVRQSAIAEAALARELDVTLVVDPAAVSMAEALALDVPLVTEGGDLTAGDVVLFDGYGFGPADWAEVTAHGGRVAQMDDFGVGRFEVDLVVNPNPVARPAYSGAGRTLIGPDYAPVRARFRSAARSPRPGTDRLLVTMGGSDPAGITGQVTTIAERSAFSHIDVVVGPGFDGDPPQGGRVQVHRSPDMAALMRDADASVAAAGSTTWELMCVGVPAVLIGVVENQRHVVTGTREAGTALVIEAPDLIDAELPAALTDLADPVTQVRLARAGQEMVDGRGAERIVDALLDLTG